MKKILVADDDTSLREMIGSFLEKVGYEVRLAHDGREVIEILGKWKPDLLLSDISMPHLTGRDVVIKLKKLSPDLPVIILSGKDMSGDIEITLSANVKHYIKKPLDIKKLMKSISDVIGDPSEKHSQNSVNEIASPEDRQVSSLSEDTSVIPLNWESHPQKLVNKIVGKIKILEFLHKGGMGGIFKGHHLLLDKIVAIKLLSQILSQNKEFTKRFFKEAQLAAQIDHPNVVRIFDLGKFEEVYYIVMEYIQGEDLLSRIKRQGAIPYLEAVKIIIQASKGIAEAHMHGVIHRDIKPENMIITLDGKVKVVDFGLARSYLTSSTLTRPGEILGTPHYMSPEQCSGGNIDPRSDIYSLGIAFYHVLAGEIPFDGITHAIIYQHIAVSPKPLHDIDKNIPLRLSQIVDKMVAKKPEERYQNMLELLCDLSEIR